MIAKPDNASTDTVKVLSSGDGTPTLALFEGPGKAHAIVWPGVGARLRSMIRIALDPGGRTLGLKHPVEAVYYVVRGRGEVADPAVGGGQAIAEGSMVHIEPGTAYRFLAAADGIELLGGPCPADEAFFRRYLD